MDPAQTAPHPFERMLRELGIMHRYTHPSPWPADGNVRRFWQTLHTDLLGRTPFASLPAFQTDLERYLHDDNEARRRRR